MLIVFRMCDILIACGQVTAGLALSSPMDMEGQEGRRLCLGDKISIICNHSSAVVNVNIGPHAPLAHVMDTTK